MTPGAPAGTRGRRWKFHCRRGRMTGTNPHGIDVNQPETGQIFAICPESMVRSPTMPPAPIPSSLLDHLVHTGGLGRAEARRMVEEVISFYG